MLTLLNPKCKKEKDQMYAIVFYVFNIMESERAPVQSQQGSLCRYTSASLQLDNPDPVLIQREMLRGEILFLG